MDHSQYRAAKYFPALDGVRTLCVLMVISYHLPDDPCAELAGFLGVTVFFILSGFLITTLSLREEDAHGRMNLKAFYIRRTFRILPLYLAALLFYVGFHGLLGKPDSRALLMERLPSYLLYYQEIPHARMIVDGAPGAPFDHAWSLGIEEKFYLVWPFLVFIPLWRRRAARLPVAAALCVLFCLAPLLNGIGMPVAALCLHPYHPILMGCCLAFVLHDPVLYGRMRFTCKPMFAVNAALALVAIQLEMTRCLDAGFGSAWQTLYCINATLLIGSLCTCDSQPARALSSKTLVWIGTLSYAMYLFHAVAIVVAEKLLQGRVPTAWYPAAVMAAAVVGSILLATTASRVVEKPMIRLGKRVVAKYAR